MAVLDILVYPDPRLKQVSKPVEHFDGGLHAFIRDLEETMRAGPGGVGIAAPQVGRFERIIIVDVSGKPKIKHHGRLILVNPEIISKEGSAVGREGCLSVPDYTGNVARAKFIILKAQDEFGKPLEFHMERYEARAVQHEMDHLEGLLFLDHLVSRRDLFRRQTQEAISSKAKIP
ncbi:MAG: peptide deformylase [Nitrospinota bacterium]|nr:peptide deformylase [Nitrospinota bacterium]